MGDVVSLSKYRKQREREASSRQRAANRVRHGRTRKQAADDGAESASRDRQLDHAKLDHGTDDSSRSGE
ncbi:MAG: DUF4169 family protein [Alphaproteobacteria bacterium]|nr:DUF4169 family protein [Alphaproteobacteria bacterium]